MVKSLSNPVMVIGTKLCEQFGINPNDVLAVDLHLRINEPATATVEFIAPGKIDVAGEIRHFKIIEDEE